MNEPSQWSVIEILTVRLMKLALWSNISVQLLSWTGREATALPRDLMYQVSDNGRYVILEMILYSLGHLRQ